MSHSILIIEDDRRIASWLKVYLQRAGFSATTAHDGKQGLRTFRELAPDLILLDLMLPRIDGLAVCKILRRESDVPIIMLTAKGTHANRISGLDSGADDYIVKPFNPDEVVARAKAVLRRAHGQAQQILRASSIVLNCATQQVTVADTPISLSQTQFALLATFMRHPNQVLTREQLISLACKDDFDAYDRAIDNHILRLRKHLTAAGHQPIRTVYGAGYKLVAED